MARLFDDASNEYLVVASVVVSATPLAMVGWFNYDDVNAAGIILSQDIDGSVVHYMFLSPETAAQGQNLRASMRTTGAQIYAQTSTQWSVNTWHHGCAIFASATDRRVFLDAGGKGTNATSVAPTGMDETCIGVLSTDPINSPASGHIAEAAIWDLSNWPGATDADKANNFELIVPSLAKGFSPSHFPLGLVAYWPLVRGLNDKVGGYNLTASGTAVSNHPRVILPNSPL